MMTLQDSTARRNEARASITAHLYGSRAHASHSSRTKRRLTLDRETAVIALLVAIIAGTMTRAAIRVGSAAAVPHQRIVTSMVAATPTRAVREELPPASPVSPSPPEDEVPKAAPPPRPRPQPRPRPKKTAATSRPRAPEPTPDVDRSVEKAKRTLAHAESELASTL